MYFNKQTTLRKILGSARPPSAIVLSLNFEHHIGIHAVNASDIRVILKLCYTVNVGL